MQNNIQYKEMMKAIDEAHYILILTHKNPDADTISSALTLSNYFYEIKQNHKVFNISKELPFNLNFLPKFDKISNTLPLSYDLVIYVDCADQYRVGDLNLQDVQTICIDHHQSNNNFADINIVDFSKGSTAEVLYDVLENQNIKISQNMATCLYIGIYDDNLAFTTPRTTVSTFETVTKLLKTGIDISSISQKYLQRDSLAKYRILPKILNTLELHNEGKFAIIYLEDVWIEQTGAKIQECDVAVDMILNIGIVEVVAYLRIIDKEVRVSLRSKNDIDVSQIAASFKGGGHKNAAGLTLKDKTIIESKKELIQSIKNYI